MQQEWFRIDLEDDDMENNEKRRAEFFGDITPCGGGYSVINGEKVHVDTLTDTEAVGCTDCGGWFAAKKDFGILKYGLTTALADAEIAKEELTIPEERRIEKFMESHEKNGLYTVGHFSSWHRRLTGACMTGRDDFVKNNGLKAEDLCTARFYLDLVHEQKVTNKALEYLRKQYEDGETLLKRTEEKNEITDISASTQRD